MCNDRSPGEAMSGGLAYRLNRNCSCRGLVALFRRGLASARCLTPSEHVWPELVSGYNPVHSRFNCNAAVSWDTTTTPVDDVLRQDTEARREGARATCGFNSCLKRGSLHAGQCKPAVCIMQGLLFTPCLQAIFSHPAFTVS